MDSQNIGNSPLRSSSDAKFYQPTELDYENYVKKKLTKFKVQTILMLRLKIYVNKS